MTQIGRHREQIKEIGTESGRKRQRHRRDFETKRHVQSDIDEAREDKTTRQPVRQRQRVKNKRSDPEVAGEADTESQSLKDRDEGKDMSQVINDIETKL